jgi:hypothetical protein
MVELILLCFKKILLILLNIESRLYMLLEFDITLLHNAESFSGSLLLQMFPSGYLLDMHAGTKLV